MLKFRFYLSVSIVIVLSLVTSMTVGCPAPPEALETEPDFTGWVTEIHPIGNKGTLGQILVESHADKIVDKYMVTIKDETLILQQDGEKRS